MAKAKTMQRGYRDVGYLLAPRLRAFRPSRFSVRDWRRLIAELNQQIEAEERAAIRTWFRTYYPALMHLIPGRRQREFIDGVVEGTRVQSASHLDQIGSG